jgi:hypothetical protein
MPVRLGERKDQPEHVYGTTPDARTRCRFEKKSQPRQISRAQEQSLLKLFPRIL